MRTPPARVPPSASSAPMSSALHRAPTSAWRTRASTDGRANGRIETPALDASWDLTFSDDHEPFHHLPRDFLYRAPLPKTKFLSPYPDALFDGGIELDGERIEVEGWRGMIGHNWGAEHAERWVWIQGSGFEGRSPEDYFDMAVGRIKVGGSDHAVGRQRDADARRQGPPARRLRTHPEHRRSQRSRPARASSSRARASRCHGTVRAPAKDFVAWIYADPVGPEHNTLNCSISDLELRRLSSTAVPSERPQGPGRGGVRVRHPGQGPRHPGAALPGRLTTSS